MEFGAVQQFEFMETVNRRATRRFEQGSMGMPQPDAMQFVDPEFATSVIDLLLKKRRNRWQRWLALEGAAW